MVAVSTSVSKSLASTVPLSINVGGGFNPASYFDAADPGAAIQLFNKTQLFQDVNATIPVENVGDPIGFALDSRLGATSLTNALGPELWTSVDGTSGAEVSAIGTNGLSFDGVDTSYIWGESSIATTAGEAIFVSFDVSNYVSGLLSLQARGTSPESLIDYPSITNGSYQSVFIPSESNTILQFFRGPATTANFDITNISIRRLPGNHATQSTATARPIWARRPKGGVRNLAEQSLLLTDSPYGASSGVTTAATTTIEDSSTGLHRILAVVDTATFAEGSNVTVSIDVAPIGSRRFLMNCNAVLGAKALFDVSAGTVVDSVGTAAISDNGDGTFRCSVSGVKTTTESIYFQINTADSTTANDQSYSGDGSSGLTLTNLQLELGSTATAYQKVVSEADITEAGVSSVYGALFDGVDDFLVTPSIDLTGTDAATLGAAITLDSAALSLVLETSPSVSSNDGSMGIVVNNGVFEGRFHGTNLGSVLATGFDGENTPASVITRGDISADDIYIKAGDIENTSAPDLGTGNFGDYPLNIMARDSGSSSSFHTEGFLSSVLLIPRYITDDETAELGSFLANKAGVVA